MERKSNWCELIPGGYVMTNPPGVTMPDAGANQGPFASPHQYRAFPKFIPQLTSIFTASGTDGP
jgi:hypothetical protein